MFTVIKPRNGNILKKNLFEKNKQRWKSGAFIPILSDKWQKKYLVLWSFDSVIRGYYMFLNSSCFIYKIKCVRWL